MSIKIQVKSSGHSFNTKEGETILDAALRQGYTFPYGCRNGVCGSCKGTLISGKVEYSKDPGTTLSLEDKAANMALFCQAKPVEDLIIDIKELTVAADIPIKTLRCRVAKLEMLNHDVVLIKLTLPGSQRLQFLAGQYVDFLLQDNHKRSFSLANAPLDGDSLELHIRQVNDGYFTKLISSDLKEMDMLRIQGPFGQFYLRTETDRPIIMMGGGTGFAPIKSIVEHAITMNITRPIHIYWGARALADLYLHQLPIAWEKKYQHISYTPVLSDPKAEDNWQGRTGYVHQTIIEDYADLSPYEIYASGPPQMVHAGKDAFSTQGLDLANYYSDAFEWAKD